MANDTRFRFQQLDIYVAARELAALVHHAQIADAELRETVGALDLACAIDALAAGPAARAGAPCEAHAARADALNYRKSGVSMA